jgi:hypothetical protein
MTKAERTLPHYNFELAGRRAFMMALPALRTKDFDRPSFGASSLAENPYKEDPYRRLWAKGWQWMDRKWNEREFKWRRQRYEKPGAHGSAAQLNEHFRNGRQTHGRDSKGVQSVRPDGKRHGMSGQHRSGQRLANQSGTGRPSPRTVGTGNVVAKGAE